MCERRRFRSGIVGNGADAEVVCPKPRRRAHYFVSADCGKSPLGQCEVSHLNGDAGFEILDIFLSKAGSFDSSPPYSCGSPPCRSGNPLVHDLLFIHEQGSPYSNSMQQQPSHRLSPSVRVEGFSVSAIDSRCSVSSRA